MEEEKISLPKPPKALRQKQNKQPQDLAPVEETTISKESQEKASSQQQEEKQTKNAENGLAATVEEPENAKTGQILRRKKPKIGAAKTDAAAKNMDTAANADTKENADVNAKFASDSQGAPPDISKADPFVQNDEPEKTQDKPKKREKTKKGFAPVANWIGLFVSLAIFGVFVFLLITY